MRVKGPDGKVIDFPDSTPQEVIKAAMAKHYGGPPPTGVGELRATPPLARRLATTAIGAAPSIGGFVGGLAGGAALLPTGPWGAYGGAVGGAAAGGAAGEAAKQALMGRRMSPGDIGLQGVEQGLYEAAGGALGAGAGRLARPIMRGAVKASAPIQRSFGDVTETLLKRGLAVSKGGAQKATRLREASAGKLAEKLAAASAGGARLKTWEVAKHARAMLSDNTLEDHEKAQIVRALDRFFKSKGDEIDPVLLKGIKQRYQGKAKYATQASKGLAAEYSEKMARGAREELERIPGVGAREAETQSLIGAERALKAASMRPAPPLNILQPGSYPIVGALGNPYMQGQGARLLNSQAFRQLLRQNPRLAAAIIEQSTQSDEPDATAAY